MDVIIHPRVTKRHPELSEDDVVAAWTKPLEVTLRLDSPHYPEYLRVGADPHGRLLEMVGTMTNEGWLVYHAMTPPSKKTFDEIRRARNRG